MDETEQIRKSVTVRGLSGLRNIGNTCYMNSALQCLCATDIFSAYFLDKKFIQTLTYNISHQLAMKERKRNKLADNADVEIDRKDINNSVKNTVVYGYYGLMKLMWSDNLVVEPSQFKSIMGQHNSLFNGHSQNDSQELMNCVLDNIHEELKTNVQVNHINIPESVLTFRTMVKAYKNKLEVFDKLHDKDKKLAMMYNFREYLNSHMMEYTVNSSLEYWETYITKSHSIIRDIFTGMSYTSTTCSDCNFTTLSFEPFLMLTMPIPDSNQSVKLEKCLKDYSTTIVLNGSNKYKCDNCDDYKVANQTTYLWESPEILIIHLKRFVNKTFGNSNYSRVEKNSTMIEYPFKDLSLNEMESPYNKTNSKYELYGVVNQMGSLSGGHYTAYCKNAINNKWYEFDDSHVTCFPDNKINDVITRNAYILFYKKQHDSVEIESDIDNEMETY